MNINNKNHPSFGMALAPISPKAYKIGGKALKDAEPKLVEMADQKGLLTEVIPQKGFFSGIEGLLIRMSSVWENKTSWAFIGKDPKKLLPTSNPAYNIQDEFTMHNILTTARTAKQQLPKAKEDKLNIFLPTDFALLRKPFIAISKWLESKHA